MQFLYDGTYYRAIRITGTKHNLLGLSLGSSESVKISKLQASEMHNATIESDDVLTQVISGLKEINHQLQSNYHITEVQFVSTDTLDKDIYKMLTKELISRIHHNHEFTKVSSPETTNSPPFQA